MTRIAVVGAGIAVPGADSLDAFWTLLTEGGPVFEEPADRYRLDAFWSEDPDADDRSYARTSGFLTGLRPHPRLAGEIARGRYGPGDREVTWLRHCLLQAGERLAVRAGDRQACLVGGSTVTSQRLDEAIVIEAVARGAGARSPAGAAGGSEATAARLRAVLGRHFGFRPEDPGRFLPEQVVRAAADGLVPADSTAIVVDTACSSSLYAVDLGIKLLSQGFCEIAYCGGLSSVTPRYNVAFAKLGGLSRSGRIRTFDQAADGTLFSDGAAVVALKTLDRALADGDPILGVLAGFGASSDGRGKAIFAANPAGQVRCVQRARTAAGLAADEVDWVITHGTGTPAGDAAELAALADGAPPDGVVCVSNKPLVGHTGWSAGIVSVIHALLTLEHRSVPAQPEFTEAPADSPVGAAIRIPTPGRPMTVPAGRPQNVGVSSFGFGGINAHLLIRRHPALRRADADGSSTRTTDPRPARTSAASPDFSAPDLTAVDFSAQDFPVQDFSTQDRTVQDPTVLVAWSAHLPGDPDRAEILRRMTGGTWSGPRDFGAVYPIPPFDEIRLPARTARALDRSQLMALRLAAAFAAEHGELWASVRDTTCVVAAHAGPPPGAVDNLLRCYASDLEDLFDGDDAKAFDALLDDVRRMTPPTVKDTLPGIMPNILASRLASRYDLHGPAMLVDSGQTSGRTALRVADLYLRGGGMDLALVLGVSTAARPELAGFAGFGGTEPARHTEGAFLVALARRSVAEEHGWPVQTRVDAVRRPPVAGGAEATFLAADGLIDLLRTIP